jgi:hypothetical protein
MPVCQAEKASGQSANDCGLNRSFAGVAIKGERRTKRSSTCTRAEAATERQLSEHPAANYRPSQDIRTL